MYIKKGFSLLSFLVYLTLFSTVALFCCHLVAALIIPALSDMRKCQSLIAVHVASDFFVRDIRTIQKNTVIWKCISPQELIWGDDSHDIGWSFVNNRLERREGTYQGGWKGTKASIVAKGLSHSVFTVHKNTDAIVGVELLLTPECAIQRPIGCYAAVRG